MSQEVGGRDQIAGPDDPRCNRMAKGVRCHPLSFRICQIRTSGDFGHNTIDRRARNPAAPRSLARAVAELGRIAKTLYLLAYLDDEVYRRRILIQLNRGERRHSLARVIFHGQRGEIRQRYRQGQEDQLGALGLVLNCVVLWNTRYLDAAVTHLKAQGRVISDGDLARLSPFIHRHVNVLGRYSFAVPEEVQRGELRPLRDLATIDELDDL